MDTQFVFRAEKEQGGKLEVFPVLKVYNWDKEEETLKDIILANRANFTRAASDLYAACQQYIGKLDDDVFKRIIVKAMCLANAVRGNTIVQDGDASIDHKTVEFPVLTFLTTNDKLEEHGTSENPQ